MKDGQNFCHSCGKSFAVAPAPSPLSRVAGHVRVLGVLWIVYSLLHLVPVGAMVTIGRMNLPWVNHGPATWILAPMFAFISGIATICAILGIIAGWGLLERRMWARMLALVLGCLALLSVPLGTALGIYTLWVLLPAICEQEYRQMARVT